MHYAMRYLMKNFIVAETAYPYTGKVGACKTASPVTKGVARLSWYNVIPTGSVAEHKKALFYGPISIALTVCNNAYQFYKTGVMSFDCGAAVNHAVLLTGYDVDKATGKTFWKIRNSWGGTWGEAGYFRVARDDKDGVGFQGML